ncbi:MAG: hypothetical protein DRG20_02345 [Deltaproteobacteria bacterium]|nr:MAG: hypothetical protein DRG20_02345 [Deltaproteobacteria bacterium]
MHLLSLILFFIILILSLFSIAFGLPGTFFIFIDALIYGWLTHFSKITATMLIILFILAIISEGLDFVSALYGAKKFGSSKRGIWLSLIGGFVCSIIMAPFFFGIGALIGGFIGVFLGGLLGGLWETKKLNKAYNIGLGAFLGRVIGSTLKVFIGFAMIIWIAMKLI